MTTPLQPNGQPMPNWASLYTDPTSARAALTQIENEIARRGGATAAPNYEAQRQALSWYITGIENPTYWNVNPDGTVYPKEGSGQTGGTATGPSSPTTTTTPVGVATGTTTGTATGTSTMDGVVATGPGATAGAPQPAASTPSTTSPSGTSSTTTSTPTKTSTGATIPDWSKMTPDQLTAAKKEYQAEIDRRGGTAPGFTELLNSLNSYTASQGTAGGTTGSTGSTGTTGTTGTTTGTTGAGTTNAATMPNWSALYTDPTSARSALTSLESQIAAAGGAASAPDLEKQRSALSYYVTALENPTYWSVNPDGTVYPKAGSGQTGGTATGPLGAVTGTIPSSVSGVPQNDLEKLRGTLDIGEKFGNGLIDTLGLNGQFLPRVDTAPSDSYYSDLGRMRDLATNASNYDPLETEAINNARNALGGLNAQENAGLRSAAVADVNRQASAQKQSLMRYQGGMLNPALRASQIADVGSARVDAQRGLQRDLLIANIDQKRQARDAFSNLVGQTVAAKNARQLNTNQAVMQGDQYGDTYKQAAQMYNSGTTGQEVASRTGALLGGIGSTTSLMGGYAAQDFQSQALQEALAAKDREIQATKDLATQTLAAQERIMKSLQGKI